jgi:hypothetical protein
MKQIKSALIILTVFASVLSSCKKSSTNPATSYSISLKVNGTAKTSTTPVAVYYKSLGTLQVSGAFGTSQAVSLTINNVKTGSFDVSTGDAAAIYTPDATLNDSYIGDTGTVVITTFTTTTVSGTFSFSGTSIAGPTGTITNGTFNAKLITQ